MCLFTGWISNHDVENVKSVFIIRSTKGDIKMSVGKNKIILFCLVLSITGISFVFADSPQNDTVNISAFINSPPNITLVILDDFTPYSEPSQIDLVAANNKTVYCLVNASDADGYANINQTSLNVSIYLLSRGYNETWNPKYQYNLIWNDTINTNACLNKTMGGGNGSDGWIDYNCSISMPYFTENGTWVCVAQIWDIATLLVHANMSANATVNELIALNISTPLINFGFLALGDNTTDPSFNTTIENIGNVPLTVNMTAHWNQTDILDDKYAMKCGVSYINETDIYFNDVQTGYDALDSGNWKGLERGFQPASQMSLQETANSTNVYYTIFWGLNLLNSQNLNPQPKGTCSGWIFFDALRG
jgi:hypothetical protein